jgi:hypothetical protein
MHLTRQLRLAWAAVAAAVTVERATEDDAYGIKLHYDADSASIRVLEAQKDSPLAVGDVISAVGSTPVKDLKFGAVLDLLRKGTSFEVTAEAGVLAESAPQAEQPSCNSNGDWSILADYQVLEIPHGGTGMSPLTTSITRLRAELLADGVPQGSLHGRRQGVLGR